MLTYLQVIILGLLQGVTELFPISSLGHSVILPKVFGWAIDQKDPFFLILNGVILYGAEILRKRAPKDEAENNSDTRLGKLSWMQAVKVGLCQAVALANQGFIFVHKSLMELNNFNFSNILTYSG